MGGGGGGAGRSFHQQRAVHENVLENGFVHLCDNTRHHSLTNLKRRCRFVRVSGEGAAEPVTNL